MGQNEPVKLFEPPQERLKEAAAAPIADGKNFEDIAREWRADYLESAEAKGMDGRV